MEKLMIQTFIAFLVDRVKNSKKKEQMKRYLLPLRDFLIGLYDPDVDDKEAISAVKAHAESL